MLKLLLLSVLIASLSFEFIDSRKISFRCKVWNAFLTKFNKTYSNAAERQQRRKTFMSNYQIILKHNRTYKKKKMNFTCGVNRYTDMTTEEFVANFAGLNLPRGERKLQAKANSFSLKTKAILSQLFLPVNFLTRLIFVNSTVNIVDWRETGAVLPIRQQGKCGSCWSFSAAAAIEGQIYKKTKRSVQLSTQNLIDCVKTKDTDGCNGGAMPDAFSWILNNGIMAEVDYPYDITDTEKCRYIKKRKAASIQGFHELPEGNEKELEKAVKNIGPISVGIQASFPSMQFYKDGIYFEPQCDPESINHAVLVVGYGSEKGEEYWIIKNSWGERWGEKGYLRLSKNRQNHCGVATFASYPIV